ncbi:hypothetical protein [Agromyces sp. SYSU T0242]|uniref:hypothetical protein n=1 Tax=Agromyces litoreus TaxID=3158561 RepID=UPI0033990356
MVTSGSLWEFTPEKAIVLAGLAAFAFAVASYVIARRAQIAARVTASLRIPESRAISVLAVVGASIFIAWGLGLVALLVVIVVINA